MTEVVKINDLTQKEMIILSSVLSDDKCMEYAIDIGIPNNLFKDKFVKRFFQTFNGLVDSGIDPTENVLLDQLAPSGGKIRGTIASTIKELKTEFPAETKQDMLIHIKTLKNAIKLEKYDEVFEKIKALIDKEKAVILASDPDKIKKFIDKAMYELEEELTDDEVKVMNMEEGYYYLLKKMESDLNSKVSESVTSGYPELDIVLSGGFKKGTYSMIAARPGMGKTVIMLNMAIEAAKRGQKVLFLSLEMNLVQCFQRIMSKIADVSGKKLQQPKTLTSSDWEKINEASKEVREVYENKFWIEEIVNLTVPQLERKVKLYKKKHNIDLVFVDYAQIMLTKEGNEPNDQSDFAEISGALRRSSKSQNVAMVVGSQLNRKVEERPNKRPVMSDIRNSGAFEQDAGAIIGLYRDVVYNKETDTPNELEMVLMKNRFGESTGTVLFDMDLDKQALFSKDQN